MFPVTDNIVTNPVRKENMPKRTTTKHQASKKGYKHVKKLSKGELNHQRFIGGK